MNHTHIPYFFSSERTKGEVSLCNLYNARVFTINLNNIPLKFKYPEISHLFVLVGGDGDKLGLGEGVCGDGPLLLPGTHLYDVDTGLVLVQRVQHDLKEGKGNKLEE